MNESSAVPLEVAELPVMEASFDGHGEDEAVIKALVDQLHDLKDGHGKQNFTEGIRYNAACDGGNHYLYKMDKSAVNPKTGHGYSKGRIYAGTLEAKRDKCPAYASNWQGRHKCRHGGISDGHGRSTGHGEGGNEVITDDNPIRWEDYVSASD